MRVWTLASVVLVLGCGAGSGVGDDDGDDASDGCGDQTQYCTILYGTCCDDLSFAATCVDGRWVCDPCVVHSPPCAGYPDTCLECDCTRTTREAVRLGIPVDEYCGVADGG
jgi:hypothetical protein